MLRRRTLLQAVSRWREVEGPSHFDVCVIGGGPAGIAAALRAVDYKKRVCLVERDRIGGCDLWNGALQATTLWELSAMMTKLRGPSAIRLYGCGVSSCVSVDDTAMRRGLEEVSNTREAQIRAALDATNVKLLFGQAAFTSDHEVQFHNRTRKEYQRLSADYFIIATGSTPRPHPFVPVDGERVVTTDHIMRQPLPKSLVIVGAGMRGCAFACTYATLGRTAVSLIDRSPVLLPTEDRDIAEKVREQLVAAGVRIHQHCTLYDMQTWNGESEEEGGGAGGGAAGGEKGEGGVQYTIANIRTKELATYQADQALICVGRSPNYTGLGLENTSLKIRDDTLMTDPYGRCVNTKHIFAVGDAATGVHLVNIAEAQAKQAVDCIYSTTFTSPPFRLESVANVSFLTTAAARVGLNEKECQKRNIAYIAASYGYDLVSRAVAAAKTDGFVKIVVTDDPLRTLLGVQAIGVNASTLVEIGALAIQRGQSVLDLAERLTAYPSVSQAFQECLQSISGHSELKPGTFDSLTVTRWAPPFYQRGGAYQEEEKSASTA